jgi:hypothetical protein
LAKGQVKNLKQELLSQLENAKNNYVLGLAALSLFASAETYPILGKSHCSFGPYSISFDQVTNLLRIQNDRDIAAKEFIKMLLRALIKETFELIKSYCAASKQASAFTAQPFYQFARMIRNCLSHNFRFKFKKHDKTLLPVNWKGRNITAAMDGSYLELSFFGYVETWELFAEMQVFVRDVLM